MLFSKLKKTWSKHVSQIGAPCFVCSVDSTDLKIFVFGVIGFLVGATLLWAAGFYLKGSFNNPESLNDYPLKLESQENLDE
ncbi:MAG: hypothetical protein ACPGJV_01140 [Bacteriovoracaceae bacterium]